MVIQVCKQCGAMVYPHRQKPLHMVRPGENRNNENREHDPVNKCIYVYLEIAISLKISYVVDWKKAHMQWLLRLQLSWDIIQPVDYKT